MHGLGEVLIPIRADLGLGSFGEMHGLAQELETLRAEVDRIAARAGSEAEVRWKSEAAETYRGRLDDSVALVRAAADSLLEAASAVAGYARLLAMCPAPANGGGL